MVKYKKTILLITIFCVLSYFMYMCIVQPVLSLIIFVPIEKRGSNIYFDNEYLTYDNGGDFEECISSVDFVDLSDNNIIGFSYLDNFMSDNWVYDFTCVDYFVLEAKYDVANYNDMKNQLETEGVFIAENLHYLYYRIEGIPSTVNGYFIIALSQSNSSVKFIFMTTDIEPSAGNFWHEVQTTGSDAIWEFLSN